MLTKRFLMAAAALVLCASSASAASVYAVTDHLRGGTEEHALWFKGDNSSPANPPGATGSKPNHFLLSNSPAGTGMLTVDHNTGAAQLTGRVLNDDGQGFDLVMNMMIDTVTSYNAKGPKGNPDLSQWTYLKLVDGTLKSVNSDLLDYDIIGLMSDPGKNYAVQLGYGANDKDPGFGLSSWILMQQSGCTTCEIEKGDINVSLTVMPLPPGLAMLPVALGLLGGMRWHRRKSIS